MDALSWPEIEAHIVPICPPDSGLQKETGPWSECQRIIPNPYPRAEIVGLRRDGSLDNIRREPVITFDSLLDENNRPRVKTRLATYLIKEGYVDIVRASSGIS